MHCQIVYIQLYEACVVWCLVTYMPVERHYSTLFDQICEYGLFGSGVLQFVNGRFVYKIGEKHVHLYCG